MGADYRIPAAFAIEGRTYLVKTNFVKIVFFFSRSFSTSSNLPFFLHAVVVFSRFAVGKSLAIHIS